MEAPEKEQRRHGRLVPDPCGHIYCPVRVLPCTRSFSLCQPHHFGNRRGETGLSTGVLVGKKRRYARNRIFFSACYTASPICMNIFLLHPGNKQKIALSSKNS